jgi:tetratricopeptide (TPR) repeat protein
MDATSQHMMAQLRQNPLDPNLLEALRRHCENVGDVTTWADALEHHARAASLANADPIELGRLHFELGNLYRDRLGRSDRAISHYRTAIDFDAAQRPAIAAARAIFAEAGKWDQVAKLLAREAESLPDGPKRAALLKERGSVLKKRLNDNPGAIEALREAAGMSGSDLGLSHELATLLLDQADAAGDRTAAIAMRREAADILCGMARNVSDDYGFAYAEAALDAVPDHEAALRLLQSLAPRLGRADSIPARWVASLQYAPDGPLSRELRLKLAIAYRTAGQLDDALVCLQPLLDRGDAEAKRLGDEISPRVSKPTSARSARPSSAPQPSPAPNPVRPSARASQPTGTFDAPKSKPISTEALFDQEPDDLDPDDLQAEPSQAAADVSAQLGKPSEPAAATPLTDLASLFADDASEEERTLVQDSPITDADDADVSEDDMEDAFADQALDAHDLADAVAGDSAEHAVPAAPEPSEHEDLTTSGVEELRRLIALEPPSTQVESSASAAESLAADAEDSERPGADEALPVPHDSGSISLPEPHDEEPVTEAVFDRAPRTLEPEPDTDPETAAEFGLGANESTLPPSSPPESVAPALVASPAAQAQEELPEETTRPRAEQARASRVPVATVPEPKTQRESRMPTRSASQPAPQPPPPDISEEPEDELSQLRRELKRRLRFRDRRGAAELAERLLAMGHLEAEAITALEDQYRMTRDFRRMRDLSMRIASDVHVPVEQRLGRLREAAMLSESKLGDVDGTIIAWREVLALLPTDDEANNKLRRLLTRLSRWDDLCELLAQRAEADSDALGQANRYRELATLQRERRKSLPDAIAALEKARSVDPDEPNDVLQLCDLYVAAGRFAEAAASLEWRVAHSEEPVERVPLLVTLGDLYETELGDFDAAYRSAEALLQIAPRHVAALDRLLRIDERLERWDQVLRVLEAKLLLGDAAARVKLQARIADIAMARLGDASRAADAYASAIDIAPDDKGLLVDAAEAFERAGRREELTESIASAAQHAREATKRFDLYQMVAERREADGDTSAAIAAREAQLAVRRDTTTLRQLVSLLRRTDRANDLVRRLDEQARAETPDIARELRLERAAVLAEQLSNLEAAKSELGRVLEEIAPDDIQVLEMLVDLCRRSDDVPRRTAAQEKLVKLTSSLEAKVDLVSDLVETFEKAGDDESAIRVLRTWIGFERDNPQPYLRIAPLLQKSGQRAELLVTHDALARLAMAEDEAGEYKLRGARVALDLEDYEGAWSRLVPRVVDAGDAAAEALLIEVATQGKRADALAELYIGLAQRDEGTPQGVQRWLDAARTYETLSGNHDKALEAVLRAFAKNLDEIALLTEADRLAELASAWPRLGQVYDALVRRAETTKARSATLMRHAKLLEEHAKDGPAALLRLTLAFQVDPTDDVPFGEATRLAKALSAHEPLLALYERRALAQVVIEEQLDALLEACRCAHVALEDTPRATSYLARAVILVNGAEPLLDMIEAHTRQLDRDNPLPHGRGLVHALSEVYAREALEGGHPNPLSALLWTRAAHLRDRALDDRVGAYLALEQASLKKLGDEALLDELLDIATRAAQLPALAQHLATRAENAIDSSTASAALSRLGSLYEGPLAAPDLAAETFVQLVKLNPRDAVACSRLRGALRAGSRHQELLSTIERQLALSPDPDTRLSLLREAAQVWERSVQNRFEALDAWRKVLALVPEDPEAAEAVARLKARPVLDDLSLLDGDLVVRPEDLRPSLPPEPEPAPVAPEEPPEPDPAETQSAEAEAGNDANADASEASAPDAAEVAAAQDEGDDPEAQASAPTEDADTTAHVAEGGPSSTGEAHAPEAAEAEVEAELRDAAQPTTETYSHDEIAANEAANFRYTAAITPVAGAAVLAHLVGEVAALRDDDAHDEGRVSELERAAFEASHAQAEGHRYDLGDEPVTSPGDSLEMYQRETIPGDPAVIVGAEPAAAEPEAAESATPASNGFGPSQHAEHVVVVPARRPSGREVNDDDQTIGWDRELDPRAPELVRLEAREHPSEEVDLDMAEHLEDEPDVTADDEEPAAVDLNALSSIVRDAGPRTSKSRIPPPPPAGAATRSAPPPPPKGARPPPPPRRD